MKNKVVIITGASSGIGKACASAFFKRGARLVLVARTESKLVELTNSIKNLGGEVFLNSPLKEIKLKANGKVDSFLIGSAFYLFFITVRDFFLKKTKKLGQNIAHFGFSLLILSILFNSIFSN